MTEAYEVPALLKIDRLLRILSESREPVRAHDLAERSGLSRSTMYLLLDSLERRHWIAKRRDGYIIGVGLFEMGCAYVQYDGLQQAFRREAVRFVEQHNEVVQLGVLDGAEVVYLAREDAHHPVRLISDLGSRLPAHCCALGKALLASLDDHQIELLLPEQLRAITERTVTHRARLLLELAEVRRSGLARDNQEVLPGTVCFSAYVGQSPLGKRLAVSTSVPIDRLDGRVEPAVIRGIVDMAQRVAGQIRA